jgi:hypothetical protein
MHLASTRKTLFAVVQRTDHLCHFGFHIFCRLGTIHLHMHVSMVNHFEKKERIRMELRPEHLPRCHSPLEVQYQL